MGTKTKNRRCHAPRRHPDVARLKSHPYNAGSSAKELALVIAAELLPLGDAIRLTIRVAPLATFTWMILVDGGRGIFLLRALSPNRISNSLNPTGFRGIVR